MPKWNAAAEQVGALSKQAVHARRDFHQDGKVDKSWARTNFHDAADLDASKLDETIFGGDSKTTSATTT